MDQLIKQIRARIGKVVWLFAKKVNYLAFRIHPYGYRQDNRDFVEMLFEDKEIPKKL